MRSAVETLGLDVLTVVHAGRMSYSLAAGIRTVAASRVLDDIAPLRPTR